MNFLLTSFSPHNLLIYSFILSFLVCPLAEASKKPGQNGSNKALKTDRKSLGTSVSGTAPANGEDQFYLQIIENIINARIVLPRFLSIIISKYDKHPICQPPNEIGDECVIYSIANDLHLSFGNVIISFILKRFDMKTPKEELLMLLANPQQDPIFQKAISDLKSGALNRTVDALFTNLLAQYEKPSRNVAQDSREVNEIRLLRDRYGNLLKQLLADWIENIVLPKFALGLYSTKVIDRTAELLFGSVRNGPHGSDIFRLLNDQHCANAKIKNLFAAAQNDEKTQAIYLSIQSKLNVFFRIEAQFFGKYFGISNFDDFKKFCNFVSVSIKVTPRPIAQSLESPVPIPVKAKTKQSKAMATSVPTLKVEIKSEKKSTKQAKVVHSKAADKRNAITRSIKAQIANAGKKMSAAKDTVIVKSKAVMDVPPKSVSSASVCELPVVPPPNVSEAFKKAMDEYVHLYPEEKMRQQQMKPFVSREERKCKEAITILNENLECDAKGICTVNKGCKAVKRAYRHAMTNCKNFPFALSAVHLKPKVGSPLQALFSVWNPPLVDFNSMLAGHKITFEGKKLGKKVKQSAQAKLESILKDERMESKLALARLHSLVKYSKSTRPEYLKVVIYEEGDVINVMDGVLQVSTGLKSVKDVEKYLLGIYDDLEKPTQMPSPAPTSAAVTLLEALKVQDIDSSIQESEIPEANEKISAAPITESVVPEVSKTQVEISEVLIEPETDIKATETEIETPEFVVKTPETETEAPETEIAAPAAPITETKDQKAKTTPAAPIAQPAVEPTSQKVLPISYLLNRNTVPDIRGAQKILSFIKADDYERTGIVLVRLAILEILNAAFSQSLQAGEIFLEIYGSTRTMTASAASDMDVIALYRGTACDSETILGQIKDLLEDSMLNKTSFVIDGSQDKTLGSRLVRRFNSFNGANPLDGVIEPILGDFVIRKVNFIEGYGMVTLVLELLNCNYLGGASVEFELDICALELDMSNPSYTTVSGIDLASLPLSEIAFLPASEHAKFSLASANYSANPRYLTKLGVLFGLSNIYAEVERSGCPIPTFLHLVRIIKKWAVMRGIYGSISGYLSSFSIIVTCATTVQTKEWKSLAIDDLVLAYFCFMKQRFVLKGGFISIFEPTNEELQLQRTLIEKLICSELPQIVNPVTFVVKNWLPSTHISTLYQLFPLYIVTSKMSFSSYRLICLELEYMERILSKNSPAAFASSITKANTNDQIRLLISYLRRRIPSKPSILNLQVHMTENDVNEKTRNASFAKMEANLYLLGKSADGTEAHPWQPALQHSVFVLVKLDYMEHLGERIYNLKIICNRNPDRLYSIANSIARFEVLKKFPYAYFTSSCNEFSGFLANAINGETRATETNLLPTREFLDWPSYPLEEQPYEEDPDVQFPSLPPPPTSLPAMNFKADIKEFVPGVFPLSSAPPVVASSSVNVASPPSSRINTFASPRPSQSHAPPQSPRGAKPSVSSGNTTDGQGKSKKARNRKPPRK